MDESVPWIFVCLGSRQWNPTGEFKLGKGLRQGDPLASFLFIIVVKGLARIVRQAVLKNLLQSVEIGTNKLQVNMLNFADDALFLYRESIQNILTMKAILCCLN